VIGCATANAPEFRLCALARANHSPDPRACNAEVIRDYQTGSKSLKVVATRDIKANEFIHFNYGKKYITDMEECGTKAALPEQTLLLPPTLSSSSYFADDDILSLETVAMYESLTRSAPVVATDYSLDTPPRTPLRDVDLVSCLTSNESSLFSSPLHEPLAFAELELGSHSFLFDDDPLAATYLSANE
jgi:hypothetical protein